MKLRFRISTLFYTHVQKYTIPKLVRYFPKSSDSLGYSFKEVSTLIRGDQTKMKMFRDFIKQRDGAFLHPTTKDVLFYPQDVKKFFSEK